MPKLGFQACNDRSHGGGSAFRSTIISYVHYRANGTIAPVRIDETGVGNYNISATLAAGLKGTATSTSLRTISRGFLSSIRSTRAVHVILHGVRGKCFYFD